jgi:hypothetical protein
MPIRRLTPTQVVDDIWDTGNLTVAVRFRRASCDKAHTAGTLQPPRTPLPVSFEMANKRAQLLTGHEEGKPRALAEDKPTGLRTSARPYLDNWRGICAFASKSKKLNSPSPLEHQNSR